MITSVTSATEAATAVAAGVATTLGIGGAILLIALMIARNLLASGNRSRHRELDRALRVATWPLLIVFVTSISIQTILIVAEALS
jgi:hypothetical protein